MPRQMHLFGRNGSAFTKGQQQVFVSQQEIQYRHGHLAGAGRIPQGGSVNSRLIQKALDAVLLTGQPTKAFQGKDVGAFWGHGLSSSLGSQSLWHRLWFLEIGQK